MLKVIYARRGTGKTKEMIKMANADVGNVKGDIVFLDKDNHCMLDLKHDIRYINTQEYHKVSLEYFMGFIGGVMASDYDIEKMYIDGVPGLLSDEELKIAVESIVDLAKNNNVQVIMSLSGKKDEMPDFIKEYVVE
jgi:hypothetical protein